MTTTTMLPRHRLYRNDIDSIVGLLNIRRRLTAGRTRIHARESTIVLFKNGFTRSYTARNVRFWRSIRTIHPRIHTFTRTHTYTNVCIHPLLFVHRVSHRVNDTRHSLWRAVVQNAESLSHAQPRATTIGPAV